MFLPLFVYLSLELIAVSMADFKTKIISNYWSISHILFFLLVVVISPEKYPVNVNTFLYPVGFIVVGFALYLLKIMGGGDSKFLATFYLLIPPKYHDGFTELLLASTVLVGFFLLTMNLQRNWRNIFYDLKQSRGLVIKQYIGSKFSFAPVILLAWVVFGVNKWKVIHL